MSIYDQFSPKELAILRQRAERIASFTRDQDQAEVLNALSLSMNNERYAVSIDVLQSVYQHITFTPVPCSPAIVCGIANIRGRILPVLDLGLLIGAGSSTSDTENEQLDVIVAANEVMTVAFGVQVIGDVINYTRESLEFVINGKDAGYSPYVQALLPDGTALLNIQAILNDPDIEVNQLVS